MGLVSPSSRVDSSGFIRPFHSHFRHFLASFPQVSGHSKSWDISEEEIINAKALSFIESTGRTRSPKVWKQGEYGVVSLQTPEKWWQRKTFSGFLLGPGKLSGANVWQNFQGVYNFEKKTGSIWACKARSKMSVTSPLFLPTGMSKTFHCVKSMFIIIYIYIHICVYMRKPNRNWKLAAFQ